LPLKWGEVYRNLKDVFDSFFSFFRLAFVENYVGPIAIWKQIRRVCALSSFSLQMPWFC